MKKLIVLMTAAVCSTWLYSEATVFKVSEGEHFCYIGGTVHILTEANYPLPSEYSMAYDNSDAVVTETDTVALAEPGNTQILMDRGMYQGEETIRTFLSPKVYEKLDKVLAEYMIPIKSVESLKPGLLTSVMTMMQLYQLGYTAEGVDSFFYKKAVEDGKGLLFLESLEQQIDFICSMGVGNEDEFILSMLNDLDKTPEYMDAMVASWEKGERELIEASALEMKNEFPDIYTNLLSDRNSAWIEKIAGFLSDDPVEFFLFGAMHLYGDDGVLQLLLNEGYAVEHVR